jgi:hypothetical protein
MSRPRPGAAASRPRARGTPATIPPTPKSVVGIIAWEPQFHTLAEIKQRMPVGGGIYIIAKTAKNDPATSENKPLVPIYVGETGSFRTRWTGRLETYEHLFGKAAVSILNAPPYNSFGVYIGRFPVEDAPKGRSELENYRKDVEWVLIRYLTQRYKLNQSKKVNTPLLSEWMGIKITNSETRPEFLAEKIEVAPGSTLELSLDELGAEPWEIEGISSSGSWFRRGRNIVVHLDAFYGVKP